MIIWFAIAIPIIAAPILYFCFQHKVIWWELAIPVVVCLGFTAIMKWGVEKSQTSDTEYWTGYITQARYIEPWTEEWDEYIPPTYDDKGHQISGGYWVHHVEHHPPYWEIEDNNGIVRGVNKNYFNSLVKIWKNHHRKKVFHLNQTSFGDGGIQWTDWNKIRNTIVVLTTQHCYENRIQAAHSVFKFPEVEDKSNIFEYPKDDEMEMPSILGVAKSHPANRFLCIRNAELGKYKQVRMWILVYDGQPLQTAIDQESYWQGGNKNEFVVCIGSNKEKINWCHVFSWTENERLKIDVREFVVNLPKLDLMKIAAYVSDEVQKGFVRKPFSDFNYLTVEPPTWAVVTTYIIVFLITAGISTWTVLNDVDEDDDPVADQLKEWLRI